MKNSTFLPTQLSFFSNNFNPSPASSVLEGDGNSPSDYEKICDFQNLYNAHIRARRCKRHKKDVILFEMNLSDNLCRIKEDLEKHQYEIGGYKRFNIYEPKEREIQALSYYDRILQHTLCDNVLSPFFDKRLIYDNCACRKGKGTHFALKRFSKFLHEHYKKYGSNGYILKCDITKYFQNIPHDVLKNKLIKVIPDKDILDLLMKIINSFEYSENRGLPMGNQTSQLFALFYLDQLDRFVKEKLQIKHYIRYMDDMVLIHPSKEYLKKCLNGMNDLVENELKLSFNSKTQIFPLRNGIDFLGFHFYLTDTGKIIKKLRRSSKVRYKNRMKKLKKDFESGKTDLSSIKMTIASYNGHLKYGHTYKLKKNVMSKFTLKLNQSAKGDLCLD